jgi:hypothetical protein
MSDNNQGKTSGLELFLARVCVGVPLLWGLDQTILTAAPIFS